jgi:hypothetical protein
MILFPFFFVINIIIYIEIKLRWEATIYFSSYISSCYQRLPCSWYLCGFKRGIIICIPSFLSFSLYFILIISFHLIARARERERGIIICIPSFLSFSLYFNLIISFHLIARARERERYHYLYPIIFIIFTFL